MTNQPQEQIEEILTAIRKVCPELMELSFGCHVVAGGEPDEPREMIIGCPYEVRGTNVVNPYNLDDTNELFSIIGHEPHLEHLLRVLKMSGDTRYEGLVLKGNTLRISMPTGKTVTSIEDGVGINGEQYGTVENDEWLDADYDLTISLRQNLETNADLREFIHSLLKV